MTTSNDFLNELFGEEYQDHLVGEEATGYVQPLWLTGYKCPLVKIVDNKVVPIVNDEGEPRMARGWGFESGKKMPKALEEVFERLVTEGKARVIRVQHQGEDRTVKKYYQLTSKSHRLYVLSHGLPSRGIIARNPARQLGIAAGVWTTYMAKTKKQKTTSFVGFLAVFQELYEAGWVDDKGAPVPVVIYAKGQSCDDLYKAITPTFAFVKAAREAGVDPRQAQLWAYGVDIRPSTTKQEHKGSNGVTEVFTFENAGFATETPEYSEGIDDDLFCGPELFKLLYSMVYNTTSRPPVPGGIAVEWSRKKTADGLSNQKEWNPKGDLPFGTNDAPASMIARDRIKDAATFSRETVFGSDEDDGGDDDRPARGNGKMDPVQALKNTYTPALTKLVRFFGQTKDDKGKKILGVAFKALEDFENEIIDEDKAKEVIEKGIKLGGERRKELQDKTEDPYAF